MTSRYKQLTERCQFMNEINFNKISKLTQRRLADISKNQAIQHKNFLKQKYEVDDRVKKQREKFSRYSK